VGAALKSVFYGTLVVYAIYNFLWLIGTTFSWGRNDTLSELMLLLFLFTADLPVMWWITRNPKLGVGTLVAIFTTTLYLAKSEKILNGFTIGFWYGPKLVIILIALLFWRSRQTIIRPNHTEQ
jgi:hypothetical protein